MESATATQSEPTGDENPDDNFAKDLESSGEIVAKTERKSGSISSSFFDVRRLQLFSGEGCVVFNDKKAGFVDCVSGDVILGHSNHAINNVYSSVHSKLSGTVGLLHPHTVELARKLVSTFPHPLTACFFVNSRSEANDLALNLAFSVTGSEEVICFDRADHGRTLACLRLCKDRSAAFEKGTGNGRFGFGNRGGVTVAPTPDTFRGKYRSEDFHSDDIGWMYSSDIDEACRLITKEGKKVGPFIVECISHEGGHLELPSRFLTEAFKTVKSYGGVCIADETHCGLGRTGNTLWAFQKYCQTDPTLLPDIVTIGKALGNGHPIAAVITTRDIAKKFTSFVSYYNYLGDPISCSIGLSVLEQLKDGKLMANVDEVGAYLKNKLKIATQKFTAVGNVRGLGLSIGLDIVHHPTTDPNPSLCHLIRQKLFERQVIVSVCGSHRNVVGLTPPFSITKQDADLLVEKFVDGLSEIESEVSKKMLEQKTKRKRSLSGLSANALHAENSTEKSPKRLKKVD